jgi:hypothetical protein
VIEFDSGWNGVIGFCGEPMTGRVLKNVIKGSFERHRIQAVNPLFWRRHHATVYALIHSAIRFLQPCRPLVSDRLFGGPLSRAAVYACVRQPAFWAVEVPARLRRLYKKNAYSYLGAAGGAGAALL